MGGLGCVVSVGFLDIWGRTARVLMVGKPTSSSRANKPEAPSGLRPLERPSVNPADTGGRVFINPAGGTERPHCPDLLQLWGLGGRGSHSGVDRCWHINSTYLRSPPRGTCASNDEGGPETRTRLRKEGAL